jgi:Ser/Thr protein kinase RdoA (MazF antagonist)
MEKKIRESFNDAILEEALRRYGIHKDEVQLLEGFESYIYEVSQRGTKRILRIGHSLHRDAAAVRGEMDWLHYLAGQGVSVIHPLPSLNGELVEVLGDGDEYFLACSLSYAPGHPPTKEDWQAGLMVSVGQLIGRMHSLARAYRPSDPRARRPSVQEDMAGFERFLPPGEEAIAAKYRQIVGDLRSLPIEPDSYGMIHQDVHGGNFFVQDGQITLFDFDDCIYGWFAYDLAMALLYVLPLDCTGAEDLAFAGRAYRELLEGYRREYSLDPAWLQTIPRFMKLREIDLYIAIHRSMDINNLDPWCARYMHNRREKILGDVPYADISF